MLFGSVCQKVFSIVMLLLLSAFHYLYAGFEPCFSRAKYPADQISLYINGEKFKKISATDEYALFTSEKTSDRAMLFPEVFLKTKRLFSDDVIKSNILGSYVPANDLVIFIDANNKRCAFAIYENYDNSFDYVTHERYLTSNKIRLSYQNGMLFDAFKGKKRQTSGIIMLIKGPKIKYHQCLKAFQMLDTQS